MVSDKTTNSKIHPATWECILTDLKVGKEGLLFIGNPKVTKCPYGNAIQFDGKNDAITLESNPVKNLSFFTIELLIRPDLDGPEEQRFLHIGEIDGDRLLIELRLTNAGKWYFDTFFLSGQSKKALVDPTLIHPAGTWYHVALTLDKSGLMTNYINGKMEMNGQADFSPINTGEMSIGMRRNRVSWYKGAIYKIRISPEVLKPEEFMTF